MLILWQTETKRTVWTTKWDDVPFLHVVILWSQEAGGPGGGIVRGESHLQHHLATNGQIWLCFPSQWIMGLLLPNRVHTEGLIPAYLPPVLLNSHMNSPLLACKAPDFPHLQKETWGTSARSARRLRQWPSTRTEGSKLGLRAHLHSDLITPSVPQAKVLWWFQYVRPTCFPQTSAFRLDCPAAEPTYPSSPGLSPRPGRARSTQCLHTLPATSLDWLNPQQCSARNIARQVASGQKRITESELYYSFSKV